MPMIIKLGYFAILLLAFFKIPLRPMTNNGWNNNTAKEINMGAPISKSNMAKINQASDGLCLSAKDKYPITPKKDTMVKKIVLNVATGFLNFPLKNAAIKIKASAPYSNNNISETNNSSPLLNNRRPSKTSLAANNALKISFLPL